MLNRYAQERGVRRRSIAYQNIPSSAVIENRQHKAASLDIISTVYRLSIQLR